MTDGYREDFEADGMVFSDEIAFECAQSLYDDDPKLQEYFKRQGISDPIGALANMF